MDRKLLTVEEVAESLCVGRSTVYELMSDGRLYSVKVGRSRRIPVDALTRFLDSLSEHQT